MKEYLSILVGNHETALKRPYYPTVPVERIEAIQERAKKEGSLLFEFGTDAVQHMNTLDGSVTAVEIFGAWAGGCVLGTIVHALQIGLKVRIPKGLTIMPDPNEQYDLKKNVKIYYEKRHGQKLLISEDKGFIHFAKKG